MRKLTPHLLTWFFVLPAFAWSETGPEAGARPARYSIAPEAQKEFRAKRDSAHEIWKRDAVCNIDPHLDAFADRLRSHLTDRELELRSAFDRFRDEFSKVPAAISGWDREFTELLQAETHTIPPSKSGRGSVGIPIAETKEMIVELLWKEEPESAFELVKEAEKSLEERLEFVRGLRTSSTSGSESAGKSALERQDQEISARVLEFRFLRYELDRLGRACTRLMRPPSLLGANRTPAAAISQGEKSKSQDSGALQPQPKSSGTPATGSALPGK